MDLDRLTSLRGVFEALIAMATFAGIVFGWVRWVWPVLKERWATFQVGRPITKLLLGVEQLSQELVQLQTMGMEEARKGTERGQALTALTCDVREMGKTIKLNHLATQAILASDPNTATFECGNDGLLVDASKSYMKWTGRTFAELAGWGWITTVHVDDRHRIREEWESAIRDVRQSICRYMMLTGATRDGRPECFEVQVTVNPIPDFPHPCERFQGVIHRLDDEG